MAATTNRARALELLTAHVGRIDRLRGTGPNPFDYDIWQSRTLELLREIFGEDSPELARYEEATGVRGRLPGVRGQAENMTLNIHGDWGIRGRLERGEAVLTELLAQLAD